MYSWNHYHVESPDTSDENVGSSDAEEKAKRNSSGGSLGILGVGGDKS